MEQQECSSTYWIKIVKAPMKNAIFFWHLQQSRNSQKSEVVAKLWKFVLRCKDKYTTLLTQDTIPLGEPMAFIDLTEFEVASEDSTEEMSKVTDTDTIAEEYNMDDSTKRVPTNEGSITDSTHACKQQDNAAQQARTKLA